MPETNVAPQTIITPESANIVTPLKTVVEALLKYHGIHEGIWGLFVRFGIGATNAGESEQTMVPAAIVPVVEIGLQKFEKETNISVDAAKANPMPVDKSRSNK